MALYLNGTGSGATGGLTASVALSTSNHSWCGFFKFVRSTGGNQAIWQIYGGSGAATYHGIIGSGGVGAWTYFFNNTSTLVGPAVQTGVWWFFALVCSGSKTFFYYKPVGAPTCKVLKTTAAGTFTVTPGGAPTVLIGNDDYVTGGRQNSADGVFAGHKFWLGGVLSREEIEAESFSIAPRRLSGLTAYWALQSSSDLRNAVGNGTYNLTASSPANVTMAQMPPMDIYGVRRRMRARGKIIRSFVLAGHGTASLAAPLNVARPLADVITGAATMADQLLVSRPLADVIGGHASLIDPLSVKRALADVVVGQATLVDATSVARGMTDAIVGRASIVAATAVARPLSDAIVGHASLTAPLAAARPLSAAIGGHASLVEALSVARALALGIHGQATLAFATVVARHMVAAVVGHSSIADAMAVQRPLADAMGGHASLVDALALQRALADAVVGHASLTETLAVVRRLTLAIGGHSNLVFENAGGIVALAVAIHGAASSVTSLGVLRLLLDAIAGQASVHDATAVARAFRANVAAFSALVEQVQIARIFGLTIHADALLTFGGSRPIIPTIAELVVQALYQTRLSVAPQFTTSLAARHATTNAFELQAQFDAELNK